MHIIGCNHAGCWPRGFIQPHAKNVGNCVDFVVKRKRIYPPSPPPPPPRALCFYLDSAFCVSCEFSHEMSRCFFNVHFDPFLPERRPAPAVCRSVTRGTERKECFVPVDRSDTQWTLLLHRSVALTMFVVTMKRGLEITPVRPRVPCTSFLYTAVGSFYQ